MNEAIVNKIIPFSSVDGPGNRTAIFLQGCNFNCCYCHNPETIRTCDNCAVCVKFCPTGALSVVNGRVSYDIDKCVLCDECIHHCSRLSSPRTSVMTPAEVMKKVRRNMPFIRGITVSGGECTLRRDFLLELSQLAKSDGLEVMLDSNGSFPFEEDEQLMNAIDAVMLDIKAWDLSEHMKITGSSNEMVKRNLDYLLEKEKLFEVRTVVVPDFMDAVQTISEVSGVIAKSHRKIRYKIIKYRKNGVREEFKNITPPTDEFLNELKTIALSNGVRDVVLI